MAKYRVEVLEQTTTTREQWFTAESEDDARYQAEGENWDAWDVIDSHTDIGIEMVEEVKD